MAFKENLLDPYRYLLRVPKNAPVLSQTDEIRAEKLPPCKAHTKNVYPVEMITGLSVLTHREAVLLHLTLTNEKGECLKSCCPYGSGNQVPEQN